MPTPTTTAPTGIKLKAATTATEPPVATEPAVPAKPPLDAALERLNATRQQSTEAALKVYRERVLALADDVRLDTPQMESLAGALTTLNLSPDDVKADVQAIRHHRDQLVLADRMRGVATELELLAPGWLVEEEQAQKRRNEIAGERYRMQQSGIQAAQHAEAARVVAAQHVRVFGTLTAAVEKHLAPPAGPYQGRVIRCGDLS